MQETKWDGSDELTSGAKMEDFIEALEDHANKSVALHKEGATFKDSAGLEYKVGKHGSIESVNRKRTARKAKRKAQRRARRKNRK